MLLVFYSFLANFSLRSQKLYSVSNDIRDSESDKEKYSGYDFRYNITGDLNSTLKFMGRRPFFNEEKKIDMLNKNFKKEKLLSTLEYYQTLGMFDNKCKDQLDIFEINQPESYYLLNNLKSLIKPRNDTDNLMNSFYSDDWS